MMKKAFKNKLFLAAGLFMAAAYFAIFNIHSARAACLPPGCIFASPTSLSFTAPQGGPNPASQIVNVGEGRTCADAAVSTISAPWLNATTGSSCSVPSTASTVSVNVTGLTVAGSPYTGVIDYVDPGPGADPADPSNHVKVTVTLTITPAGAVCYQETDNDRCGFQIVGCEAAINSFYTTSCTPAPGGVCGPDACGNPNKDRNGLSRITCLPVADSFCGVVAVNGACGTANGKTYLSTDTGYGADTFCSAGTSSPALPPFPPSPGSASWQCLGSGGGTTASCSASRAAPPPVVVNGACGTANKTYLATDTSYGADTFCSAGTASPASPPFPPSPGSSPWSCLGSGGGTNASCSASRVSAGQISNAVNFSVIPGGTVNVVSQNVKNSSPVPSSWTFLGSSPQNPCALPTPAGSCNNKTGGTFPAMIADSLIPYTINTIASSAGTLYSLEKVGAVNVASAEPPLFGNILHLVSTVAYAQTVSPAPSLTLWPSGASITFIISWWPEPQFSVTPASQTPAVTNPSSPAGSLSVANSGSPGSTLNWTAATNKAWLSLSQTTGATSVGTPTPVSLTYLGGLSPGSSDTANVVFTATRHDGNTITQTVTVTVNVGGLPLACSPNPSPDVNIGQNAVFSAANGTGVFNWTAPPDGIPPGQAGGTSFTVNYPTAGAKTVYVNDGSTPNGTSTCAVNVANVYCNNYTALPQQIVVGGSSNLSWICHNANSCSIASSDPLEKPGPPPTGSYGNVATSTGNLMVTPRQKGTVTYTLSCVGGATNTATYSTKVTVSTVGTGRIEK